MNNRYAVILAAGKGTRMKSSLYKVLHPVCGKPMVEHVVDELEDAGVDQLVTVTGHGAEAVEEHLKERTSYVLQEEQLGTAHAVMQTRQMLEGKKGTTIVACGDTPLIQGSTMQALMDHHEQMEAKASILTAVADDPAGYGRVVRGSSGEVVRIVEHKDADEAEKSIREINTGTYCFDNEALFHALSQVDNNNIQGEYYLPDVIGILQEEGETVSAWTTPDFSETIGVNDRVALSQAEKAMKRRINEHWMRQGVTIIDPENTYISKESVIGADTVIEPGTILRGSVHVGTSCQLGPHSEISNAVIGSETVVRQSTVTDSEVGNSVQIGPYAHIRPASSIGDEAKIGNFVEIKKASIGQGSKTSHLSYIGDAEVGKNVNIGCGSITVNYDGMDKHLTKIEDNVFIGCNSNLVAPVNVGKGAYVAAGSTITSDVPEDALSIARSRQTNKENYVSEKLNAGKKQNK